jgi:two-component system chemotaxis response regulator CheB
MVKVLVVEDSASVRELLVHILSSDPEIRVLGTARNGQEALEFLQTQKPDVITMDIVMPVMDGLETTRQIMSTAPIPVIIVSSSRQPTEVSRTFLAMEAGAVAALDKPAGPDGPGFEASASAIRQMAKLMAEVKLVKRTVRNGSRWQYAPASTLAISLSRLYDPRVVAVGASTGGPQAIAEILCGLPKAYPLPLLVVQHIAAGFVRGMADWLRGRTELGVQVASEGEPIVPGRVYVAPDGSHMGIGAGNRIAFSHEPPEHGMRPSVSRLFGSVTRKYGSAAVGVLLTGMGKDGAEELRSMREAGALTVAQDKESSVVHGMPGEAIRLNGASHILCPEDIARLLLSVGQA